MGAAMTERLRILELNKYYPPHVGGVERVVCDLAEGFARRGHRVRVLACRPQAGPRRIRRQNGVLVIEARTLFNAFSMPVSIDFLRLVARHLRWADVLHWHEPFPLATLGALLPGRILRMVTWHSDIVRQRVLRPAMMLMQALAVRKADAVVATSRRLAAHSAVVGGVGRTLHVIPIGIALGDAPSGPLPGEQRWLDEERPLPRYALFVGRLIYYKGVDVLLEAARRSPANLVIVGRGPLGAWVEEQIRAHGLADRVRLVGRPVDDGELRLFYKHCDYLVLPSVAVSEAFGIVQVEAMAYGKPVINTDLPTGVPTVSLHGVTGLTVPPSDAGALADAMTRLWTDHDLRRRMAAAAAERARAEFQLDRMTERYLSVMRSSIARAQTDTLPFNHTVEGAE